MESSPARHAAPPVVRRSPWNRRRDRLVAAALVIAVVVAAVLVWAFSDSRATSQETAPEPPPLPAAPESVPATLTEVWRAPSTATPEPVAEGRTTVTAAASAVQGRDPLTGAVRWHYRRDLGLCTVAASEERVLAVYRKDTGCSEVTQLDPGTGRRTAQRNGDAEPGTRLVTDGKYVTATGKHLLNTWRNDLVKSMEYGKVYAPTNPDVQPRSGCTYRSVAADADRIGVVERCSGETSDRLTVLKAVPEESDRPEEVYSTLFQEGSAKLVAMSGNYTAVVRMEQRRLAIYGADGKRRAAYDLDLPAAEVTSKPEGRIVPTSRSFDNIYWFTGSRTMALSKTDLTPRWTLRGTLGPGTTFAGQYVVPIPGGLAVLDERSGKTLRTVGIDRRGYGGPVRLTAAGPVLLEQRGGTVVALR